jgi:hypothetical protein
VVSRSIVLVDLVLVIADQQVVVPYSHFQVHSHNSMEEVDIGQLTVVGMVGMRKMMDRGGKGVEFHSLMEGCCSLVEGAGGMSGVLDPSWISVAVPG